MTTTPPITPLKIGVNPTTFGSGNQFAIFVPDMTAYNQVKSNKPVPVEFEDVVTDMTFVQKRCGTLNDMLNAFGSRHYSVANKPYDAGTVADELESMYPDDNPCDVRTWYSVIVVTNGAVAGTGTPAPGGVPPYTPSPIPTP
jgi:hypothetical protein